MLSPLAGAVVNVIVLAAICKVIVPGFCITPPTDLHNIALAVPGETFDPPTCKSKMQLYYH